MIEHFEKFKLTPLSFSHLNEFAFYRARWALRKIFKYDFTVGPAAERGTVIETGLNETLENLEEIEKKIIKVLDQKVRPAVAKDGGDIKFKEFKDGIVKVQLQGSCSGCPSSTMTLKQGVQNLLCHYVPEVKEVIAI